jgi:hypothetical protein
MRSGQEIACRTEFASAMTGLFAKHKEAVISLIIWAVVATGCLLYFTVWRKPHEPRGTAPTAVTSAPTAITAPTPASSDLDFPGYFVAIDKLADRLSEKQEFVKSLKGRKIRWRGYVAYVRNSDVSPTKIALAITPTPGDERMAVVYFGQDMHDRLFALREKDSVEITGTFDTESWDTPYVQGNTVQTLSSGATHTPTSATAAR